MWLKADYSTNYGVSDEKDTHAFMILKEEDI